MGTNRLINEKAIEGKAEYESATKAVMLHHFVIIFPLIGYTEEIVPKKEMMNFIF